MLHSDTTWIGLIDAAIAGDGLRPEYQPIVDLQRGVIVGYEALARFDQGPPVAPNVWFAEAARQGRACDLDRAVLRAVLDRRRSMPPNTFLTVNIEPESLVEPATQRLLSLHAPLDGLVIEITEHRELGDPKAVELALDHLRALGARIAIDDAGAGYSGLQQILTLRPDILKIDRSLVEGIDTDEPKAALVEMLGAFANRIDAWILTEGIETAAEARRCIDLGVPLAQGWFFGRAEAPWSGLEPGVAELFDDGVADARGTGLRRLLAVSPIIDHRSAGVLAGVFDDVAAAHLVAVDGDRPIGLIDPASLMAGELRRPLFANIDTTPAELAHRIATSASEDALLPTIVIDDGGRYLGTVALQRLLGALAST